MKLRAGQAAIDFSVKDMFGREIRLSDYKGKRILLGFFRNVNCPFCNLRVHELTKLREALESKNMVMIFMFESSNAHLKRSSFHQEVSPIPLIGDPEKKIYAQYGVEASVFKALSTLFTSGVMADFKKGNSLPLPQEKDKDASQTMIPGDFLIDENFNIVKAYYGKDIRDHIAISEIKVFAGI